MTWSMRRWNAEATSASVSATTRSPPQVRPTASWSRASVARAAKLGRSPATPSEVLQGFGVG